MNEALNRERTAMTNAGVLRTERPANVHVRSGVDLAHEDPLFVSELYGLASAHPSDEFDITSGARTFTEQLHLWERYRAGVGGIAAAPGTSNHDPQATGTGYAEAMDVVVNGRPILDELGDNALALFGLHGTVPNDRVHITPMQVSG